MDTGPVSEYPEYRVTFFRRNDRLGTESINSITIA